MRFIELITDRKPIVFFKVNPVEPTVQQAEREMAEFKDLLLKSDRIAVIVDGTEAKFLSSEVRIQQGQWIKNNTSLLSEKTVSTAYVIPSVVMQMILKCIFLIKQPPVPIQVFSKMEEALNWSERNLEKEGLVAEVVKN